ncbi:MAG: EpsG family protein, partial [Treponema sp.]|nr:EpsG family protein [Treponema sp.]
MEYSVVIYILLTVFTVALGMLVDLQAGRIQTIYGRITRQRYWNRILVVAVFLLLFAVSACRIAVGNDYWVYRSEFLLIQQNRTTSFEPGFVLAVKALQSVLDYDQYLPIFAVFSFFTVLFFVRGMANQSDWFGFTVFLLMTSGYYFSSLNSVRYYLVLSIALYAIKYVLAEEWWRFVLCVLVAALFHKSVLIVLPLYFLASRRWKKWHIVIVAVFCISLVLLPGVYRRVIFTFYPFYEGSIFDTGETSITNLARCAAILLFSLLYYKDTIRGNHANEFYFYCNLGALLLYTFASF